MTKAHTITMRYSACSCGCKGKDWAHKKHLKRVVRNLAASTPSDRSRLFVVETGTISVLGSDIAVERRCMLAKDGSEIDLGWYKVGV